MTTVRRLSVFLIAGLILTTFSAPAARAGLLVTANDDAYTGIHDRVLSVAAPGLLANDTGLLPTAAKLTNPAHGTVTVNANGSFTYRPSAGYVGSDSFTYEARVLSLGILFTDPATVTITVTNATPVAVNDSYVATTAVTLTVPAPGVLANDHDADGDALTASLVSGGGNGSLSFNGNGSFSFTSGGSFTGTRTFTYQVSDGISSSGIATVSIQVSAPAPTPIPAPTPTPTPNPTPTPIAVPSIPIPSVLPSVRPVVTPIPLPIPLPLPTPTIPPVARPTPSPTPGATSSPAANSSPSPGSSSGSSPSAPADSSPGTTGAGTTGPGADGTGSGTPGSARRAVEGLTIGTGDVAPFGLADLSLGTFGGLDWAIPALAMTVPGLLLILAVLAQLTAGALWLPVVRRRLGSFGIGRRRRRNEPVTGRPQP